MVSECQGTEASHTRGCFPLLYLMFREPQPVQLATPKLMLRSPELSLFLPTGLTAQGA